MTAFYVKYFYELYHGLHAEYWATVLMRVAWFPVAILFFFRFTLKGFLNNFLKYKKCQLDFPNKSMFCSFVMVQKNNASLMDHYCK